MSAALNGNLRDFGIGEVFQLIGAQQKTGILEVAGDQDTLRLAFDGGAVVQAERIGAYPQVALGDMLVRAGLLTSERLLELEPTLQDDDALPLARQLVASEEVAPEQIEEIARVVTLDTIFALLRWRSGSFHFTAQPVTHARSPEQLLPAEQILMDGLRMVDEWRTFDEDVQQTDTVFERRGRFETYREAHRDQPPEKLAVVERLFLLIDGRLPVRRVIDLSRLGDFEGARLLSDLRRRGLIAPVDPASVRGGRRLRVDLSAGPSPVGVLLAVLPFALLFAAALSIRGANDPQAAANVGIRPDPVAQAGAAFEARRLRNGVEAWRFARGSWPASLDELSAWEAAGPLAGPEAHQYYYVARGDTFLLLAPEEGG